MPYRLLRFALSSKYPERRMFRAHDTLKSSYDVVIIGAGGHGLASAFYLARDHGSKISPVLKKATSAAVTRAGNHDDHFVPTI